MSILTTSRRFILALAFALFALQSAGLAHGYAYDDDPHEHDGQVCSVALVAPDVDDMLPAMPVIDALAPVFAPAAYTPAATLSPVSKSAPRAPPVRGPPLRSF